MADHPLWQRLLRVALVLYAASAVGAAVPLVLSDVCTQYDIGVWWAGASPVLGGFGAFVIFALAFSVARDGSILGMVALLLLLLALAAMIGLFFAAVRARETNVWVWTLAGFGLIASLISTFFFCASLSV